IDEASLRRFGQWPWPRAVLADLVSQLSSAGASVIALDVVFAEPEQRLAIQPAQSSSSPPAPLSSATPPVSSMASSGDELLAQSLEKSRVVLGHYFRFGDGLGSPRCQLKPVSLAAAFLYGEAPPAYPDADAVTCSLVELSGVAAGSGFLNASPDADGVLRRIPLLIGYQGKTYPSLALAAVMAHRQLRTVQHRQEPDRSEWLRLGELAVPLSPQGALLLRFPSPSLLAPRLSAASLADSINEVNGKIVLIGGFAAGLQDTTTTPVASEYFGTAVHATAIENLLTGSAFRHTPNARLGEILLLIVLGVLSTWLIIRFPKGIGAVMVLALCVTVWCAARQLMESTAVFVSPIPAILLGAINLTVLGLVSLSLQRTRADSSEAQAEAARQFMISMLTSLAAIRDLETGEHLSRMKRYTWLLSVALSSHPKHQSTFPNHRIALISELAPLHDIGKVGVPDAILRKPGPLTAEEFAIVKQHVDYGRDALMRSRAQALMLDSQVFDVANNIISHHHERWDGTGYPQGLAGEAISIEGRIVAVVDVYDALVSDRVYKKAISHQEAIDILRQGRGTHFDPVVVDAFLRIEQWILRERDETANESTT
ncbi:MAG: CHASE2 domain-containing protein, partial [Bryobacterales bacterium]|nr:CHASE2 domain-containing protein [Bryobacterales bacterium]